MKVQYQVEATVKLTLEMDEDLQGSPERMKKAAEDLLGDRMTVLDCYGARGGMISEIEVKDIFA
tara:strand:- start:84 stop:275 length:192 start_codon:yes stop_codon:yes gene_type:complete